MIEGSAVRDLFVKSPSAQTTGVATLMTPQMLKELLETRIPQAKALVTDLTGTFDHYGVDVTSPIFEGKSLIEQHKIVHSAVGEHLTTTIHALQIKTRTP